MSTKKKKKADSYETIPRSKSSSIFVQLFCPMLQHPNYIRLSDRQKTLYTYMKLQKYGGNRNRPEEAFNDTFYFNWALASKTYQIYRKNKSGFYGDIKALVDAGFIEVVTNGRSSREKSVYKYSDKWYNKQ